LRYECVLNRSPGIRADPRLADVRPSKPSGLILLASPELIDVRDEINGAQDSDLAARSKFNSMIEKLPVARDEVGGACRDCVGQLPTVRLLIAAGEGAGKHGVWDPGVVAG
jgi:hypothetical protein